MKSGKIRSKVSGSLFVIAALMMGGPGCNPDIEKSGSEEAIDEMLETPENNGGEIAMDNIMAVSSKYYLLIDEHVYIQAPVLLTDSLIQIIDRRIENYAELIGLFPNQNFYVFYLERMAFAPYNPLAPSFPEADNGRSFQYFLKNKPEKLEVAYMLLENLEQHKELFFRTDHHWNIRGAWKAYEIIYEMLSGSNPEIGPKLELFEFVSLKDVVFCGSYARRTLHPCVPEQFEYARTNLPDHQTWVDGEQKAYGSAQKYFDGDFEREEYTNHYAEFFGYTTALVEYRFENASNRNLLIIGGSYNRAMQMYVASHYRNTFVVDPREYEGFSMGEFFQSHKIDDVLILGDVLVYGSDWWLINP